MSQTIRAKFHCSQVAKTNWKAEIAELHAVTAGDKEESENTYFNKATPGGKLSITIDNPNAQGFLKPGSEYYIDFTEVL